MGSATCQLQVSLVTAAEREDLLGTWFSALRNDVIAMDHFLNEPRPHLVFLAWYFRAKLGSPG